MKKTKPRKAEIKIFWFKLYMLIWCFSVITFDWKVGSKITYVEVCIETFPFIMCSYIFEIMQITNQKRLSKNLGFGFGSGFAYSINFVKKSNCTIWKTNMWSTNLQRFFSIRLSSQKLWLMNDRKASELLLNYAPARAASQAPLTR